MNFRPRHGVRLATFNVLFGHRDQGPGGWPERLPLLRRAIETARPDILGLQEVFPSRLASLAGALGDLALIPGPCNGCPRWFDLSLPAERVLHAVRTRRLRPSGPERTRSERMTSGAHQPIAYHPGRFRPLESGGFWISSSPERPGSMLPLASSPFLVHWACLERQDGTGTLRVFNAHFGHAPWHHGSTARITARQIGIVAGKNPKTQSAGPSRIELGTFLIGDFNAWPSSPLVRRLTSASGGGFVDAGRAAPERIGPPVTFHWGLGSARLGLTLDYVLARSALRATRAEVIDVHDGRSYPSDHYPLVVEFGA
jgi:endonuclease/exonuclease/phosphatase family metal-dependent hydrolase